MSGLPAAGPTGRRVGAARQWRVTMPAQARVAPVACRSLPQAHRTTNSLYHRVLVVQTVCITRRAEDATVNPDGCQPVRWSRRALPKSGPVRRDVPTGPGL